jgi:hypothetical protein
MTFFSVNIHTDPALLVPSWSCAIVHLRVAFRGGRVSQSPYCCRSLIIHAMSDFVIEIVVPFLSRLLLLHTDNGHVTRNDRD